MGDQVEKIMEIPGGRASNAKPSGTENPVGWGVRLGKKPSVGGYGYFLEPHNVNLLYYIAVTVKITGKRYNKTKMNKAHANGGTKKNST